jgi:ribonuclease HI
MINIYCDGACTGNGTPEQKAGLGIVVEWQGKKPSIYSIGGGNKTNNEAEYNGLLETLKVIKENDIKVCTIKSDSNLMVNQVNANWQCRDAKLLPLLKKAWGRMDWLKENGFNVRLEYIPREFNLADNPAKRGKDLKEGEVVKS